MAQVTAAVNALLLSNLHAIVLVVIVIFVLLHLPTFRVRVGFFFFFLVQLMCLRFAVACSDLNALHSTFVFPKWRVSACVCGECVCGAFATDTMHMHFPSKNVC